MFQPLAAEMLGRCRMLGTIIYKLLRKQPLGTVAHENRLYRLEGTSEGIVAYAGVETSLLAWVIDLSAVRGRDDWEQVSISSPAIEFGIVERHSDIQTHRMEITFGDDELFNVSAGFYDGVHHFPNCNQIRISRRQKNVFRVRWKFNPQVIPDLLGRSVSVYADLSVTEIRVVNRGPDDTSMGEAVPRGVADQVVASRFEEFETVFEEDEDYDGRSYRVVM